MHSRRIGMLIALVMMWGAVAAQAAHTRVPSPAKLQRRAEAGIEKLQKWYVPSTGLYRTTGWWNSANALTMLADYSLAAHSSRYNAVLSNSFEQAQKTSAGFLNKFYDDEGWWALAWIAAYDLTHEQRYLDMAESIFADMAGGWDATCRGGIWWSKDRKYKNAIANELFLSVAAHLANRVATADREKYLDWAEKEWRWFERSGMINHEYLINDGLDAACRNNGETTWTYNQGVILGGLAELARAPHAPQLLAHAKEIADAAMTRLSNSRGVLHDACEPKCGADGVQFKGIFLRNLVTLNAIVPDERYGAFAMTNAESIWKHARGPDNRFGQVWAGPYDAANAGTQSSALDAFVAALALAPRKH
jgi:predicted alpha-1,6-mannanase (GH76 family)